MICNVCIGIITLMPSNGLPKAPTLPPVLPPVETCRLAAEGVRKTPWFHQLRPVERYKDLTPATPLLVQWVDKPLAFYYLVPFNDAAQTLLVVMVDAFNGRFKEAVKLSSPGIYPPIDVVRALAIMRAQLPPEQRMTTLTTAPALVWRPCRQSQSPYEPLWHLRTSTGSWYVDQSGRLSKALEAPLLRGGAHHTE